MNFVLCSLQQLNVVDFPPTSLTISKSTAYLCIVLSAIWENKRRVYKTLLIIIADIMLQNPVQMLQNPVQIKIQKQKGTPSTWPGRIEL